jgi:hypothetical protein
MNVRRLLRRGASLLSAVSVLVVGVSEARADDEPVVASEASPAPEPPPPEPDRSAKPPSALGTAGTVVLSDLLGLGAGSAPQVGLGASGALQPMMTGWLVYQKSETTMRGTSYRLTTFALAPTLDVFIADRVSLGGQLTAFHTSFDSDPSYSNTSSLTGAGLRPRLGYVVPLGDTLAFWPRAFGAIAVAGRKETITALDGTPHVSSDTLLSWSVGAEGDLVARLGRVVLLTLGPTVAYGKVQRADTTSSETTNSTISFGVRGGISLVL